MSLEQLLEHLNDQPEIIEFDAVQSIIEQHYQYEPASFTNGDVNNEAGTNEGSCKIFAFGALNKLTKEQTLACFGHYYREHVLANPEGNDHQNIRQFMEHGWDGVNFGTFPLTPASE